MSSALTAGPARFGAVSEGRENNFDFLRFLFASLVLLYHCFPLLLGSGPRPQGRGETLATLAGGAGVDFFFVISGFLVSASWARSRGFWPYLRKRILRIYPAFLLASCFGAFVVGPLGAEDSHSYWHTLQPVKFALYLFLLPADVVGPDMATVFTRLPFPGVIDGSFWTLRYEFGMYLLVAAFGTLGLFGRRAWVLGLFGLLSALFAVTQTSAPALLAHRALPFAGDLGQWLRLGVFFLSGMLFFLYRDKIPVSSLGVGLSLGALLAAGHEASWLNALLPLAGSYALFFAAFERRLRVQNFAKYGDFSYGLYLFAFPIQQLLVQQFRPELSPARLFFAAFPLTLLLAALSWHFVEKPCLALKKAGRQD